MEQKILIQTPNRIRLLDETVANQIAAGEVIERPASVVRELVENSMDAGADRIEVEIQRGGKNLIRVTDNGCGMNYDDALLCLERHATSKIRLAEDLMSINSYGFRGEAIPSIASVCRFRLQTRERDAEAGTEIVMERGKMVKAAETGCPPGTMVEVRSLFSNTPARRKFLRSEQTEWAHIDQALRLVALTRPGLHLTVRHNGQTVAQYPAVTNLEERLPAVFGRKWVEETLSVEAEVGSALRLSGVIGKPGVSRANRQEQHLFVNGRPVQNATLNFALLEGYHNSLMKGRYPVAVLFLEIDPSQVDVNVHPAKKEVRFRDGNGVREFVSRAVGETLRGKPASSAEVKWKSLAHPMPSHFSSVSYSGFISRLPETPETSPALGLEQQEWRSVEPSMQKNHDLRVIGVILNLYIIAEGPKGLVLIDQHAAHERILFEQMLSRLAKDEVLSQNLLLTVPIELAPREADFLRNQLRQLQKIGVGVSDMGGNTFMIDALPPMVRANDVEAFFRDMLVDLQEAGGQTSKKRRLSEEVVAKTVCRHAVKANDTLRPAEVEKLLADLHSCELPYTCPHGRPTMIHISQAELERKFGRVG